MSMTTVPLASNVILLLKSDLLEQQSELKSALHRAHKEIRALADSAPCDVGDESYASSSKETIFTAYSQSRAQLGKVEAALKRISMGAFGICAGCGDTIHMKRLHALPWVNNCIDCQQQSEQSQTH